MVHDDHTSLTWDEAIARYHHFDPKYQFQQRLEIGEVRQVRGMTENMGRNRRLSEAVFSGPSHCEDGVLTTGRVSQVATMRSVIQRYHAGDRNMRGKTGPSMKILPKKLPKNRVTTKYRPRADTAIWGDTETQKRDNKSLQHLINSDVRHY